MELDLQVSPEEIISGAVAAKVGLLSLRVVPQQQCNGQCPCDSAQARKLKQQLRSALVAGQWRGNTALTLPLFWGRSTVSSVFFGRYPRSVLRSFVPPTPPPPPTVPNKLFLFYGRKAKCIPVWVTLMDCLSQSRPGGAGRGAAAGPGIRHASLPFYTRHSSSSDNGDGPLNTPGSGQD